MSEKSVILFGEVLAHARGVVIICRNPYHRHRSPMQEMNVIEYLGHHVAITRDGDVYSVRLDRDPLTDKHNLTEDETVAYVERMCKTEVIDVQ